MLTQWSLLRDIPFSESSFNERIFGGIQTSEAETNERTDSFLSVS